MTKIKNAWEIIQERYDRNNENGIPLKDFIEKYWQNTVDDIQKLIENKDLKWVWKYADEISKLYRSKYNTNEIDREDLLDAQHHINNILEVAYSVIEDLLEEK